MHEDAEVGDQALQEEEKRVRRVCEDLFTTILCYLTEIKGCPS